MTTTPPSSTYLWKKRYQLDYHRGLRRKTSPARALAHVLELRDRYGVGVMAIADAAGTSPLVISELLNGKCTGMMISTETAILKVHLGRIMNRPHLNGRVPSVGTRRRLQALLTMGWRHQDLTPMLGFDSGQTMYLKGMVTRRKHEATKRVYDQLWNKRGPADLRTLRTIEKAGYAPPLAWDDDSIDDPNALPDLGAKVYAQGRFREDVIHKSDAVVEDVEFMLDQEGIPWEGIIARLGMASDAAERMLQRKGRGALVTRAKSLSERRAYARAS